MWLLAHDTKHIVSVLTENVLLMILPDHIYRLIILLGKNCKIHNMSSYSMRAYSVTVDYYT